MTVVTRTFTVALLICAVLLSASRAVSAANSINPLNLAQSTETESVVAAYRDFYGITGGAVAVLRGEELVYSTTFGDADVALDVPVTIETKFQLSSSTKLFSATLMTVLAKDGLVDFEKPVRHYLPELPESWSDVLLEDIMSHLSGLPEVLECDESEDREAALLCVYELERPVLRREKFIYNQTNYLLVMMIIESVTGESFADALSRMVLVPAGMSSAVLNGNYRDVVPGRATSYYPDDDGGIELREYEFPWFLLTAAGLNVSLDDMIAFAQSLNGNQLLDSSWRTRMLRPPTLVDGQTADYALGWDLDELRNNRRSAGHEGGYLTTFRLYPDAGLTAIVLTNGMHDYYGLDEFADVLVQTLDPDILTPLDSLAYRAKLQYMESGLDAAHRLIAGEICATDSDNKHECEELLEWLAEELTDAGHSDDAAELLRRFEQ